MASKSTISITFKLDADGKGFAELSKDADGFKKVLKGTVVQAEQLNAKAVNFAAIATGLDQIQRSVSQLQSVFQDLSNAYAVQVEAETKLETVMRQRMGASEADVQAIKNLASAQQELGVIGDEVQLSGAQQLATFLKEKSSLEQLIPAMNNLLAQQKGLNATTGDAVNIGNMMGKVMQGQTAALKRAGITFTDAQEQILKFGTESQKAATLAQVIKDNVGDMNAELAKTDVGKQKQLENTLGDLKEKAGSMIQGVQPFITFASTTTTALTGVLRLTAGMRVASAAFMRFTGINRLTVVVMRLFGATSRSTAAANSALAVSANGAAVATKGLSFAITRLMITTGVGAAIAGLVYVLYKLVTASNSATKSLSATERGAKEVRDEFEAWKKTLTSAAARADEYAAQEITRLDQLYKAATNEALSRKQRIDAVKELQSTYPATFANLSQEIIMAGKAAQAYDDLRKSIQLTAMVKGSQDYMAEVYKNRQTAARNQKHAAVAAENWGGNKVRIAQSKKQLYENSGGSDYFRKDYYDYIERNNISEMQMQKVAEYDAKYASYGDEIAESDKLIAEESANQQNLMAQLSGMEKTSTATSSGSGGASSARAHEEEKTRLEEITDEVSRLTQSYITASDERRVEIRKEITALNQEKRAIELLQLAAAQPTELKTLADINAAIAYQKTLRETASKEDIANIDKETERLEGLKTAIEDAAFVELPADQITTYEQLEKQRSHLNDLIKRASAEERVELQKKINLLDKIQETWDDTLADLKKPGEIGTLKSLKALDDALGYWREKLSTCTLEEQAGIYKTIQALERKREAYSRTAQLADMARDIEGMQQLEGRELKVQITATGFDGLTAKIRELQRLLADTENPVTDAQRADIERMIGIYGQWRRQIVRSFDTFREGYNQIKNLASGIASVSDALSGNKDAWESVTAAIDGLLQVADSIAGIAGIFKMFKTSSETGLAAKGAEAAGMNAVGEASTQAAEDTAAGAAITIAANTLEAASFAKVAAAATFAAHAFIPFAGTELAAGMVARQAALIKAAGIPKFAKGGIAYGPTLGLFGEYAGASNNPEVVAPLDRLRSLIRPQSTAIVGGRFEIEGRKLVAVLANETRIAARSGRRSQIKN